MKPITLSATFGEEWKRSDDWGAITSFTIKYVRPGERIELLLMRNQICVVEGKAP